MEISVRKLNLIERLMGIKKESVLARYEELLIEAELLSRSEEAIKAIEQNEVVSVDDFKAINSKWLKEHHTK